MRPFVDLNDPFLFHLVPTSDPRIEAKRESVIRRHLTELFGSCQVCPHHEHHVAPPVGATVEVMEPLQTCHPTSGRGLDVRMCVPRGVYRILTPMESSGSTSHWLSLYPLDPALPPIVAVIGYAFGGLDCAHNLIDWRGILRHAP